MKHWEAFYRGGALATGPVGADGLYDQEVRAAWETFFAPLADGSRILDVGTGNGVVPLIAAMQAQSLNVQWAIDATDLAMIEPRRFVRGLAAYPAIVFRGGIANERLPFDAGTFNAITGHFALEYGDIAASLAEAHRVLAPDGRAQFILHHRQSVLLQNAAIEMLDAKLVLRRVKLYDKLDHLLTLRPQTTPATVQAAADDMIGAIRELKAAYAERAMLAPDAVRTLAVAIDAAQKLLKLRQELTPAQLGNEVARAREEMEAALARLNDLVEHALDDNGFENAKAAAVSAGFQVQHASPLFHAVDHLIGWQLKLVRASSHG